MHKSGWKTYRVPDAFIYHLQGQSIGGNVRSRIEFYRSRYKFFSKWHSRSDYLAAVVVTLGLNKQLRHKFFVYSQLLVWHFMSDKRNS
jgi:GT2 family glycosyltransferase